MSHCLSPVYTRAPSLRYGRRRREDHHLGTVWAAKTTCHYMQSARVCGIGAGKKWRGSTAVTYRNCLSLSFFFLSFTLGGPFLMRPGAFWWSALVVISVQKLRPRIVSLWCQKIPPSSPPTTEEENGRGGAHTHATKRESTRKKNSAAKNKRSRNEVQQREGGKKNKSVAEEESPSSWEVATDGPRKHPNIDTNKTKQKNKNHNTYK